MALYEFKLVDPTRPDDPRGYREGTTEADSKEEAEETLMMLEQKKVDYRMSTDEFLQYARGDGDLAEKMINDGINMEGYDDLPVDARGMVHIHHQSEPYEIEYLRKVKGS